MLYVAAIDVDQWSVDIRCMRNTLGLCRFDWDAHLELNGSVRLA
jgi:hypothetical protein